MLKKAAAEADQAIRDSLPAPAECKHEFSPSFQRKMRRTFRKAKHPVIYKLPKYAACFILAVALASGTWLTVDAEARAAFFAWVREQYESFVEYGAKKKYLRKTIHIAQPRRARSERSICLTTSARPEAIGWKTSP